MSCYMEPDSHIDVLVWSIQGMGGRYESLSVSDGRECIPVLDDAARTRVGRILKEANIRGVNARYGECEEAEADYEYHEPRWKDWTPVDILKACNGYEYQSCEAEDWEGSRARAIIDSIRRKAIHHLAGYDESEAWEINEHVMPAATRERLAKNLIAAIRLNGGQLVEADWQNELEEVLTDHVGDSIHTETENGTTTLVFTVTGSAENLDYDGKLKPDAKKTVRKDVIQWLIDDRRGPSHDRCRIDLAIPDPRGIDYTIKHAVI